MPSSNLTVVYAREDLPPVITQSIFLVGPTPRSPDVPSWRPEIIRLLEKNGYQGVVLVPEDRPDPDGRTQWRGNYDHQIDWETRCLNLADIILVWLPRNLDTLPGFTTNVEWGVWQASGKIVLGVPQQVVNGDQQPAPKTNYLLHQARQLNVPVTHTAEDTVAAALRLIGRPARRQNGERLVPLHIWHHDQFRSWYDSCRSSGHRLLDARVAWSYWGGHDRRQLMFWGLEYEMESGGRTARFVLTCEPSHLRRVRLPR